MTRRTRLDDLASLAVPSQPTLSPDGTRVVYVLRTLDVAEDRNVDQLWTVSAAGGIARRNPPHLSNIPNHHERHSQGID